MFQRSETAFGGKELRFGIVVIRNESTEASI